MLRTIVPLFVLSVSAFGSQIHTISFTGVATVYQTDAFGVAATAPYRTSDTYFGIGGIGDTFAGSIQFTDDTWDGKSALGIFVECGGCASSGADFDNGNGRVTQYSVGLASGGAAGYLFISFDSSGRLAGIEGYQSSHSQISYKWTSNTGVFDFNLGGVAPYTVSHGYLTNVAYDGASLSAAAAVPNPEPGSWLLMAGGILVILRRSIHR